VKKVHHRKDDLCYDAPMDVALPDTVEELKTFALSLFEEKQRVIPS